MATDATKPDLAQLGHQVKTYLETKGEILRLTAVEKAARTLSSVAAQLVLVQLFLFFLLFGSYGLVSLIKEHTERASLAYVSVAFLYLFVLVIYLVFFQSKVQRKLNDRFIDKMLNDEQDQ